METERSRLSMKEASWNGKTAKSSSPGLHPTNGALSGQASEEEGKHFFTGYHLRN